MAKHQTDPAGATPPAEGAPESAPPSSSSCADRETRIAAGEKFAAEKVRHAIAKGDLTCADIEIKTLNAELRSAEALISARWQSIETAPKDGAEILLWAPQADDVAVTGYHHVGRWCDFQDGWAVCADECTVTPSHWIPLPAPPVPDPCTAEGAETMTAQRDEANRQLEVANATIDLLIPKQDEADAEIARLSLQLEQQRVDIGILVQEKDRLSLQMKEAEKELAIAYADRGRALTQIGIETRRREEAEYREGEAAQTINDISREEERLSSQLHEAQTGWRCFHCDEVFTTPGAARDHFGVEGDDPGCLIDRVSLEEGGKPERGRGLLMALRKMEDRVRELRGELDMVENDARLWHASEADRVRRIGNVQWWQEIDYREGEKLALREQVTSLSSQLAGMREALTPLPCCASCGAVAEMTIKWEEEDVSFLRHASNIHDLVTVKARVPVWTCNVCEQSYTDAHAENIRQQVIDAARAALSVAQAPTSSACSARTATMRLENRTTGAATTC